MAWVIAGQEPITGAGELIVRLLQAVLFGVGLAFPCGVIAQMAPTAAEEFKQTKCKQMADEKGRQHDRTSNDRRQGGFGRTETR